MLCVAKLQTVIAQGAVVVERIGIQSDVCWGPLTVSHIDTCCLALLDVGEHTSTGSRGVVRLYQSAHAACMRTCGPRSDAAPVAAGAHSAALDATLMHDAGPNNSGCMIKHVTIKQPTGLNA